MLHIIPSVKYIREEAEPFGFCGIRPTTVGDPRLTVALSKLPQVSDGASVSINIKGESGEGYELTLSRDGVHIDAESARGAFYAIQTLRQIFESRDIPCLHIKDEPDFAYRGFYHDASRGKIASVETVKKLIDYMAYFKYNSLQIYVEHTFEFKECKDLNPKTGFLTAAEMRELDEYCKENFIDFVPSLSTFGHMFEILNQDKYKHLSVLSDYENDFNFWKDRMRHHTIDPRNTESFELVKSLIDQYMPNFSSEWFNVCCDETFDLESCDENGELYVSFVKKIIDYVTSKGKRVMMWGDILLKHPETISSLPEDIYYLNWNYLPDATDEGVVKFKSFNRTQVVCTGSWAWSRLCERDDWAESNISLMAEYGKKNGAAGLLHTNWGDWGNPAPLELSLYGLVFAAEKSWSVESSPTDEFYSAVDKLLYGAEGAKAAFSELSVIQQYVDYDKFCVAYFEHLRTGERQQIIEPEKVKELQEHCTAYVNKLSSQTWKNDECRQEMIIAAKGACVMAQINAKMMGHDVDCIVDTNQWLEEYSAKWQAKNKPCELRNIQKMFTYMNNLAQPKI